MGKASCVCPYYSTRRAVKQAQVGSPASFAAPVLTLQLVTLPYNLLLQKNAREALDLRDQIVVIDEAHNLIDTLLGIHSTTLTSYQLSNAASQLQQYLQRFRSRLKPVHALWVRQTLGVLQGLVKVCERYVSGQTPTGKDKSKAKVEMLDTNQLMGRLGGGSDQVNLMEMVAYLKESKLARKVSGFTEKSAEEAAKGTSRRCELGLTNRCNRRKSPVNDPSTRCDCGVSPGRGVLALAHRRPRRRKSGSFRRRERRRHDEVHSPKPGGEVQRGSGASTKRRPRWRDHGACEFPRVGSTRSLPLGQRLFPPAVPCHPTGSHLHAIMRARHPQIQPSHASHLAGSSKAAFRIQVFEPGRRESGKSIRRIGETVLTPGFQLTELGAVIQSVIGLVPHGVVVFLPSYAFLDKVKVFWTRSGSLQKVADKKQASCPRRGPRSVLTCAF
jgi:hypothetical protein